MQQDTAIENDMHSLSLLIHIAAISVQVCTDEKNKIRLYQSIDIIARRWLYVKQNCSK